MTWLQAIVTIVVALISGFGGSYFSHRQFLIKRQDEKEEKNIQKLIDDAIGAARKEISGEIDKSVKKSIEDCGEIGDKAIEHMKQEVKEEFAEGLRQRGEEGRERFEKNSRLIDENSKQINELLVIVKDQAQKFDTMAESLTALNKVTMISAESQKNSTYDRLLVVMNPILRKRQMTITEKTNLKQLYKSWQDLRGYDPKIDTMYEECMKLSPVPDEDVTK